MVIEGAGAAINERSRGFNAYIHRRADFNTYLNTYWDSQEEKAKAFAFMDRWLEIGQPWTNQEAYQNYPKSYVTNWQRRYWAEYYPVLYFVKRKYDPANIFRFEQSIGAEGHGLDSAHWRRRGARAGASPRACASPSSTRSRWATSPARRNRHGACLLLTHAGQRKTGSRASGRG